METQEEHAGNDGTLRVPTVYRFGSVQDLVDGWQTHVAVQWRIHEESARSLQTLHYWIGGTAAVFASLAGSSALVAWQSDATNVGLTIATAFIAAAAAVLTGIATFLDLGGRAERHRAAAAEYKGMLRQLEAAPVLPGGLYSTTSTEVESAVVELEQRLSRVDSEAPIPPWGRARSVLRRGKARRTQVEFGGVDELDARLHP